MKHLILAAALAAGCAAMSSSPVLAATRTYDCSKAGNANKTVCKTAAKPAKAAKVAKAAPVKAAPKVAHAAPAAKPTVMQRLRGMFGGSTAAATPAAKRAAAPRRMASATPASAQDRNPAGAIAQCKDGTYSHSKDRRGACSRHGGVAKWG